MTSFASSSFQGGSGLNGAYVTGEQDVIFKFAFLTPYNTAMFVGIIMAFLSCLYFWTRHKYNTEIVLWMLIIIVPSSILGARTWYVMMEGLNGQNFFEFAGLSIQGGVMGACICVLPYMWWEHTRGNIDFRTAVGFVLASVLLGQVIGRWGNFGNHEVYGGKVSRESLNWLKYIGLGFVQDHMYIAVDATSEGFYRAPFFLYESFANFIGYIFLVWMLHGKAWGRPGTPIFGYMFWYGMVRMIMEPLRDPQFIMKGGVSSIISYIIFSVGIVGMLWTELLTRPIYGWMEKLWNGKNKIMYIDANGKETGNYWDFFGKREYEKITVIKPIRKYLFFGEYQETRNKYLFFGTEVPNLITIWAVKNNKYPLPTKVKKEKVSKPKLGDLHKQ